MYKPKNIKKLSDARIKELSDKYSRSTRKSKCKRQTFKSFSIWVDLRSEASTRFAANLNSEERKHINIMFELAESFVPEGATSGRVK
jgi:hypothetical protein